MRQDADILIIGSGVGGATLAKELTERGKKVLVVEKGRSFPSNRFGSQWYAICNFYDKFALWSKSKEGVAYYRAIMTGGTSIISCGNGVRAMEKELKNLGIDLSEEFLETEKELGIRPVPDKFIGTGTRMIMDAANRLGIKMAPMPKFIDFERCVSCGNCVLGCRTGAKWSALQYLKEAQNKGASLVSGINVTKVLVSGDKAIGAEGSNRGGTKAQFFADKIVLAAGGIGTPVILQNSGLEAGKKLFLDLFNVTMGQTKDTNQAKELTMAAVSQHPGFILSPFLDCALGLSSVLPLRHILKITRRQRMLGIMAKIEDDCLGRVNKNGLVEKTVTCADLAKLNAGRNIAKEILITAGVNPKTIVTTKIRGAHPGGTAAIGEVVNTDLETQIRNLFISDASVLPKSPGLPPIVTIIALAKRLAKHLKI